jgi:hypothetical protein
MSLLQPFVLHFEVFFKKKKKQEEKEEEEGSRQLEFEIPSPRELCGSNCKIIFIFLFYEVGEIN